MKTYAEKELCEVFNKFTLNEQIQILYTALDVMQEHNSRSKSTCIFMAMGYENYEGDKDTWTKEKQEL